MSKTRTEVGTDGHEVGLRNSGASWDQLAARQGRQHEDALPALFASAEEKARAMSFGRNLGSGCEVELSQRRLRMAWRAMV
jgi:hypothetical protein